jgi:hypothetical protein
MLQDRMAAVELMLLQKPIVCGQYTGHAFRDYVLPMEQGFRKIMARCVRRPACMGVASLRNLLEDTPSLLSARREMGVDAQPRPVRCSLGVGLVGAG